MTGNGNLQDSTSYHSNFDENIVILVISNKISGGAYKIWQQLAPYKYAKFYISCILVKIPDFIWDSKRIVRGFC